MAKNVQREATWTRGQSSVEIDVANPDKLGAVACAVRYDVGTG